MVVKHKSGISIMHATEVQSLYNVLVTYIWWILCSTTSSYTCKILCISLILNLLPVFQCHRKTRMVQGRGYIPHSQALNVGESQLVGFPTSGLYELKLSVDFHSVHA